MDNPNITMEEYIRLEEEKAHRRGKVYNWETATYGKIWDNEDVHDLGSVETEFPAIVFNDTLTSEATLSCEPTVSCFDDLDFFKDFENEFPTILYSKAPTSNLLTEPTVSIRHILGNGYGVLTSYTVLGPHERKIDDVGDVFTNMRS
ncbi:hypothetical protein Tco_0956869 [Tanacetum coccineum]